MDFTRREWSEKMNMQATQQELQHAEGSATPIKDWVRGVQLEEQAHAQLRNIASRDEACLDLGRSPGTDLFSCPGHAQSAYPSRFAALPPCGESR